jgi:DNA-binding FrmR family transcriptional regulator
MTSYKKALERLNRLKGHIKPTVEALTEREKASFCVDKAREALWSTFPDHYFITHE